MIKRLFDDQLLFSRTATSNGNDLLWRDDLGIGYLKSNGYDYDQAYWDKYLGYRDGLGVSLTEERYKFALKHMSNTADVCDVGIGSGQFVERSGGHGFDINPVAQKWLYAHGYFGDPYKHDFEALTMWDVLEHIDDPSPLLERHSLIITSLPIHSSLEGCLASKHLRPDEHIWHFTHEGIIKFMGLFGYECQDIADFETKLGRESIMTYCFKRPRL